MTNTMTMDELRDAVLHDDFNVKYKARPKYVKEGFVFDENKSVKWNRNEVSRVNAEMKENYEAYKVEVEKMRAKEHNAIIQTFASEYNVSNEKVEAAYNYAYSESHSSGMYDVLITLEEVMDLYEKMNSMD
mgnify:CR=1 FL=1